jgi:hypothetical protein
LPSDLSPDALQSHTLAHEDVEAETGAVRLRSAVPAEAAWIARGVMSLVD